MILRKVLSSFGYLLIALFLSATTMVSGLKAGYSTEIVWIGTIVVFSQAISFLFISQMLLSIAKHHEKGKKVD